MAVALKVKMENSKIIDLTTAGLDDNPCNLRCEQYVLQQFGITASEEDLRAKAAEGQKEGSDPLSRIGNDCAYYGLCVSRRHYATLKDIRLALEQGAAVIVPIHGDKIGENESVGGVICVLALEDEIVAYDPNLVENPRRIARERFIDAWRDSKFLMVSVNRIEKVANTYSPAPLNLDNVTLPEELDELTEAIAENTHEVWSRGRMDEGWTYGAERDDDARKHPDLLPYSSLSEGEKDFDRATAMNAIKLIVKLGYRIEKK